MKNPFSSPLHWELSSAPPYVQDVSTDPLLYGSLLSLLPWKFVRVEKFAVFMPSARILHANFCGH